MKRIAAIAIAVVSGACAPRVPLEVSCLPAALQQAACTVKTMPGARLAARTEAGAVEMSPLEEDPDGTTYRVNLIDAPLDAKTVSFEAEDRAEKHRPGRARWAISFPVRYRLAVAVATNGLASFHFTLPPGAKLVFDGHDLAPAGDGTADATFDLLGDLPVTGLEKYAGSRVAFTITGANGASVEETRPTEAPDVLVRDVQDALRHKGRPLPFAASLRTNAGPRPLAYLHGDVFSAQNGLTHLRDLELVALDDDYNPDDEEVDLCEGMYVSGDQMAVVTRWRNIRNVEVYEARTGALRAKKTFRGSMPRGCRDYENIQTIDGHATSGAIFGGPVDDAAVDAWLATLPAKS